MPSSWVRVMRKTLLQDWLAVRVNLSCGGSVVLLMVLLLRVSEALVMGHSLHILPVLVGSLGMLAIWLLVVAAIVVVGLQVASYSGVAVVEVVSRPVATCLMKGPLLIRWLLIPD